MSIVIGEWVTREHRGLPHLVESIVAGDAVTKCGRRLHDEPTRSGGELIPTAIFGLRKCRMCYGSPEPAT